jgi:hypothetical protein
VLATHVVGAGEDVAERRPAQDERGAIGPDDAVRQVGVPAGDRLEAERRHGAGHVLDEPSRHRLALDAGDHGVDRLDGHGGRGGVVIGRRRGVPAHRVHRIHRLACEHRRHR